MKIKENALEIYEKITGEYSEAKICAFLTKHKGTDVFVHEQSNDNSTLIVSKYEQWEKIEIPYECFEIKPEEFDINISDDIPIEYKDEEGENEEEGLGFLEKYGLKIGLILCLLFIAYLGYSYFINNNKKDTVIEKTRLELLSEKRELNIRKVGAKMKTQKIIKKQIDELQKELKQNIKDVRALEYDNSLIREQMIDETENFN